MVGLGEEFVGWFLAFGAGDAYEKDLSCVYFLTIFFGAVEFLFAKKTTEVASVGIQPVRVPRNFSVASTFFGKFGEKITIKIVLENRENIDLGKVAIACKFFSTSRCAIYHALD